MLFNSIEFAVFFPVVTALYFALPHRWRWCLLLVSSCIFYMAFIPYYIAILGVTIVIDYVAGLWVSDPRLSNGQRKSVLTASVVSTCLVLFVFKYFNFANANLAALARTLHWNYPVAALAVALPIGLSFHTFQSLSYVIEVYRGQQAPERNFGIYALYVMFYPQLVAGPIERPQNLLHQFRQPHVFEYGRVTNGLKLMLWGLFKKVVIADRVAIAVNQVYHAPQDYTGLPLILATVFFALQIYCDFSGYSDMAIGAAQVMGFRLMDNFNRPYFAKSIAEFWKRWHISLSTWFRDYFYIPLGGNRVSRGRWQANLFLTFLVSGLWHGANWTYIIWGGLNGLYLVVSLRTEQWRQRLVTGLGLRRWPFAYRCGRVAITFALVCFAWIFFRAASLADAWHVATHLFLNLGWPASVRDLRQLFQQVGLDWFDAVVACGAIALMETVHLIQRHRHVRQLLAEWPAAARWGVYYALLLGVIFFGVFDRREFIYFQF